MVELSRCRWCNAAVRWALTAASRKPMPLDPDPDPRGNAYLDEHGFVHVLGAQRGLFGEDVPGVRYVPHWATCPSVKRNAARRGETLAEKAARATEEAGVQEEIEAELRALCPGLAARVTFTKG